MRRELLSDRPQIAWVGADGFVVVELVCGPELHHRRGKVVGIFVLFKECQDGRELWQAQGETDDSMGGGRYSKQGYTCGLGPQVAIEASGGSAPLPRRGGQGLTGGEPLPELQSRPENAGGEREMVEEVIGLGGRALLRWRLLDRAMWS